MTRKENRTLVFNGTKLRAQIADELGISQSQLKVTESATNHGGGGSRVEVAIAVVANASPSSNVLHNASQLAWQRADSWSFTAGFDIVREDIAQEIGNCTAGQYQGDGSNSNSCFDCPGGKFSSTEGMVACQGLTVCPAGKYVSKNATSVSAYDITSISDFQCKKCAPAMYSDKAAQLSCSVCPKGKYQPDQGSVFCENCLTDLDNSITLDGSSVGVSSCVCKKGFFMGNVLPDNVTTSYFARTGKTCKRCSQLQYPGAICSRPGLSVQTLETLPGYWRATNISEVFHPCTGSLARKGCIGGLVTSSADLQCAEGHTGLMCSVCDFDNNFVDRFGVRCGTCAENEGRNALLVAVGALVGCLLLVLKHMQNKRQEKGKTSETRTWVDLPARLRKELKIRSMKLRVLLSFIQVCVRLQVAFRLQFPPLVVSFLSFLSFFDFGRFIQLVASSKCLIDANAVTQLYFQCYGTLALLVGLAVAGAVAEFIGRNKKHTSERPQNGFFDLILIPLIPLSDFEFAAFIRLQAV